MHSKQNFVIITDRGGHLHNALMFLNSISVLPTALITTNGPELIELQSKNYPIVTIPYIFSWYKKIRIWNPFLFGLQLIYAMKILLVLKPKIVISFGAFDVVGFCYLSKIFYGTKIYHIECMNQVTTPSLTGRALYPIVAKLYVQWPELLSQYGPKAFYAGWVL